MKNVLGYFKNLLIHNKRTGISEGLTSSEREHLLIVTYVKYKTFTRRALNVCGPKLWNVLPIDIQNIRNYDLFKKGLTIYLFTKNVVDEM